MKKLTKKYLSTLKNRLAFGISSIVVITIFIIGSIFLVQYKQVTLDNEIESLEKKAIELADVSSFLLTNNHFTQQQRLINNLKRIGDVEYFILDSAYNLIITTDNDYDRTVIKDISKEVVESNKLINYEYSELIGSEILAIVEPIMENDINIGYVVTYKNVSDIYDSYNFLIVILIISIIVALIFSITLSIIFAKKMTKTINKISEVMNKVKNHDYSVQTNIIGDDEISLLAMNMDSMISDTNNYIIDIKSLESRAKELVANVSHEFKTPLTLIRGFTMNMQDKSIKPSKEIYQKIINNTEILEKLVNELLEINRYQANQVMLTLEEILLTSVVKEIVSDMNKIAGDKNINITTNINVKENVLLEVDYIKFRQLLTIFLDNAIKYSDNNTEIIVKIEENGITIKDTGKGMTKKEVEQIFSRYYQTSSDNYGYGLGLCIAKHIADLHKFTLTIKSRKGYGTTIFINFKEDNI